MQEQLKLMDQVAGSAVDMGIRFGPKLLVALLILTAGVFAGRWAGRALRHALAKFNLEPPVLALIERFSSLVVLGVFVIMALQNLGVELLPLIAGLGIAGAGGELHQAILEAFRKRNIAIPFPQREIRMAAGAARAYLGSA